MASIRWFLVFALLLAACRPSAPVEPEPVAVEQPVAELVPDQGAPEAPPVEVVDTTPEYTCATDADCTTSSIGASCCTTCQPHPIVKAELAAREAACATEDVDCPRRHCPKSEDISARCDRGQCVVDRGGD